MTETIMKKIENRIRILPKGTVIIPSDFAKLGNDNAIRQGIYKLTQRGMLISLGNGMYKKANFNELLQKEVPVDPNQLAKAYARKKNWIIFPSKNLALNVLGLSTQVPNTYTYKSNGTNAEVQIANNRIVFEKVMPKNMAKNQISNIVIEAINYLGKETITNEDLRTIKNHLSVKELNNLKSDSQRSTIWIKELIQEMEQL
ncbi:DUF6088 family protein [Tetragenococcus koreensis]|uniref:Uncharacterized protein n=1 Tax=Tetragenococcus koreensis TaxID=290335 RepID=A0AAN4RJ86_9ENTE|nr:DUF6088 family protein [Tetragenococcus koreensis]GEQ48391.1 hypothetical protein TK11N_02430 [Tetragenococcus koreensis]GEQ50899.1 hypothetical protein TK12N_02430 [Tetragenococcus koreensis]GEQ53482.1 hypothetical protein TK2N_03260 [Tetragenococcus koreensis]GEQ55983.1 hypothetical protein TK4N_03260 [Tetragenococcus koreensis]GEQ58487.1 hypothetical protein TK6N_03260 [Tetragenococcus koreensis]